MARAASSFVIFLRQSSGSTRQNSSTQIRKLNVEAKDIEFNGEGSGENQNYELPVTVNRHFTDMAKQIAEVMKKGYKWRKTLLSEFPSFDFTNPQFFYELLKHQSDPFCSLQFFSWLRSNFNFVPDEVSCSLLFDSLLDAKASKAAKYFLEHSGFNPEQGSLERYIVCLCQDQMIDVALDVFLKFKDQGVCPSLPTWNSALLGCLNVRRTDLFWKLYHVMMEFEVGVDIDVETVEYLIRAFCLDDQVFKGYELLRKILESGLVPGNQAFIALISRFSKQRNYDRVSEILHIMIAKNCALDINVYLEVIKGLFKNKRPLEASRVFYDLKNRGFSLNSVMYTNMIHGLCKHGLLNNARKLWLEMISDGILPNEYSYNALINGIFRYGEIEDAMKLYKEMCDEGYRKSIVTYNMMIFNLFLRGRANEALCLFKEMLQKGIDFNLITYTRLIFGFCKNGKIGDGMILFNELLTRGFKPSTISYLPIIRKLCEMGDMEEAKWLWNDMQTKGLKPKPRDYARLIDALCENGFVADGMEWFIVMRKNELIPYKTTLNRLLDCLLQQESLDDALFLLSITPENELKAQKTTLKKLFHCCLQHERLDDSLLVLDFMSRVGYSLGIDIWCSLLSSVLQKNSHSSERLIDRIIEGN